MITNLEILLYNGVATVVTLSYAAIGREGEVDDGLAMAAARGGRFRCSVDIRAAAG
jgi:hypothetical protein